MFGMKIVRSTLVATTAVLALSACSVEQVADNTGETVGAVGRVAVRTVAGAGRLAGRGVAAGYNALTEEEAVE